MYIKLSDLIKVKGIGSKTIERIRETLQQEAGYVSRYNEDTKLNKNQIYQGDCLKLMNGIPDKSIDMVFADLPYEETQNYWDNMIDLDKVWLQYNRVIKDNGAIVLFGGGNRFAKILYESNSSMYKYSWFWKKDRGSGFLNASKQPLRNIEEILVFYKEPPTTYNPQFWEGKPLHSLGHKYKEKKSKNNNYGEFDCQNDIRNIRKGKTEKYPLQLLEFKRPHPPIFSTQKPVELHDYLIRTYTNKEDLVLDNCIGSGTTIISCINTNRNYIGIELKEDTFKLANKRISFLKAL